MLYVFVRHRLLNVVVFRASVLTVAYLLFLIPFDHFAVETIDKLLSFVYGGDT